MVALCIGVLDIATRMVGAGLRAQPGKFDKQLFDHLAGPTPRDRQRYVLGLVYPCMFFYTIISSMVGASIAFLLDRFGVDGRITESLGLGVAFVPTSVMLVIYVRTFFDRFQDADPAALVLTQRGRRGLPAISLIGYVVAIALGITASFAWA